MAKVEDELAYGSILAKLIGELTRRAKLEAALSDAIAKGDAGMSARISIRRELEAMGIAAHNSAKRFNSLSASLEQNIETLDAFKKSTPADKMLYVGQALSTAGKSLTDLRDNIYRLQNKLGTTFSTAVESGAAAFTNQITSLFTDGPALNFEDTIDAINAYQKEFGILLTRGAAADIAKSAKLFGTDLNTFAKAQRAFLSAGGLVSQAKLQQQFITQFRAAGLTANQALVFAANNANLVAIAGVKYADSLGRAAANATKIGVSLEKTSGFYDNIVDDFEGGLESAAELQAMGFQYDFSEISRLAGTGTDEERQRGLVKLFQQNNALLEDSQRNAFLRRQIEKTTGFNISQALLLGRGKSALPGQETKPEVTENSVLASTMKLVGPIFAAGGVLTTAIGLQTLATVANTMALTGRTGLLSALGLGLGGGAALKIGMGALGLGLGVGGAMLGREQMQQGNTGAGLLASIGGGAVGGAALALALAPFTGGSSLLYYAAAMGLGAAGATMYAAHDIAMGPGNGRVLMGPEGAFKLNPKDSILAGTNMFPQMGNAGGTIGGGMLGNYAFNKTIGSDVVSGVTSLEKVTLNNTATMLANTPSLFAGALQTSKTAPTQSSTQTNVNVDMSKLEAKFDKLVSAFGNIKIEMDGSKVGHMSVNAGSQMDRLIYG